MPYLSRIGGFGCAKGTPNKQSIPAIKAEIVRANGSELDSLKLGRLAAAGILEEINKLKETKYKPAELVDGRLVREAGAGCRGVHPL
jgi:hypothetical protein